jgi:hypothetical protein
LVLFNGFGIFFRLISTSYICILQNWSAVSWVMCFEYPCNDIRRLVSCGSESIRKGLRRVIPSWSRVPRIGRHGIMSIWLFDAGRRRQWNDAACAALSQVSGRCVYGGVAEVSV